MSRNSQSPVIARDPSASPYPPAPGSRAADLREADPKAPWSARYAHGHSMGFGNSNERGVAEDEATDEISERGTPEGTPALQGRQRARPALRLDESANKKPRRKFPSPSSH